MNGTRQRYIDISVGIFMVLSTMALLVMILNVSGFSGLSSQESYRVTAEFSDIGGLKIRAPVTIAGVSIGEVDRIELQSDKLNAKVTLRLRRDKSIPYDDLSARILTQGLLGANYISLVPGFSEQNNSSHPFLREGDEIARTQEAIILENLIGQLLFNIKK